MIVRQPRATSAVVDRGRQEELRRLSYGRMLLEVGHEERRLYVVDGSLEIGGDAYVAGDVIVFRTGDRITLKAGERGARVMLLGGQTLSRPCYIWWNFVASSKEKIEEAKEAWAAGDWEKGRFQLPPGDTEEFIALPGRN